VKPAYHVYIARSAKTTSMDEWTIQKRDTKTDLHFPHLTNLYDA